jgi:small-conductance mechanosensitive channel
MTLFRLSVTYGLLLGLIVVTLTGSLGAALSAAATTAAAVQLGALLSRRLVTPNSHQPTRHRRRIT